VLDIARTLSARLGIDVDAEIVQRFRGGDIRHCYADISAANQVLGFRPRISAEGRHGGSDRMDPLRSPGGEGPNGDFDC